MKLEELNLAGLKYFLDTVETGSLTEAAAMNFVTRPAVSQAISRLEQWAGIPLLKHQRKSFELTPEGQRFYRVAKQGFAGFQSALTSADKSVSKIKVGCSMSLADAFLIPSLKQLSSFADLEIKAGASRQLMRNLEDREISLAIMIDDVRASGLQTEVLHFGSFTLASKSGLLSGPIITTEDRDEVRALRKVLRGKMRSFEAMKAESWSLCLKLASRLNGTCLVPDILVEAPLKPVRLQNFKSRYRVLLVHHRTELVSEAEANLIQLLRKAARN